MSSLLRRDGDARASVEAGEARVHCKGAASDFERFGAPH